MNRSREEAIQDFQNEVDRFKENLDQVLSFFTHWKHSFFHKNCIIIRTLLGREFRLPRLGQSLPQLTEIRSNVNPVIYYLQVHTSEKELSMLLRVFSCVMVLLLLSMPCLTLAQQSVVLDAKLAAKRDADADVNLIHWRLIGLFGGFLGGCLLGSVMVASAYIQVPPPPADRFIGKSPEYILTYTDAYESRKRDLQVQNTAGGCLAGSVASAFIVMSLTRNY